MAASATFALKSGEWFRRVRFVIFAPDSHAKPCALSGRDSTHRTDRNCGATSQDAKVVVAFVAERSWNERSWNGLLLPITRRTQIPIATAARTLVSLIAVSFLGGFRTTAPGASGNVATGPSSETLHTSGHSRPAIEVHPALPSSFRPRLKPAHHCCGFCRAGHRCPP